MRRNQVVSPDTTTYHESPMIQSKYSIHVNDPLVLTPIIEDYYCIVPGISHEIARPVGGTF